MSIKTKEYAKSLVSANKNLVQNFLAGAVTIVQYDNVNYDLLNEYDDGGTWQFTPVNAGYYLICAHLSFTAQAGANINILAIYYNGLLIPAHTRQDTNGAIGTTINVSAIVYLTPNDTIDIRFQCAVAGAVNSLVAGGENGLFVARVS